jgi:lipopolysaccharide export system protein LptC
VRLEFAMGGPDKSPMTDGSAADARSAAPPVAPPPEPGRRVPPPLPPLPSGGRDRLAGLTSGRENAIPAAIRHSARVSRLRKWILWTAGGVSAFIALAVLVESLRFLPIDLRLARVALKGTRIVIETPKLVGYRKDGRPYEVRAKVGMQDISRPELFDLEGLEVRVETKGDEAVTLTAPNASYSTRADSAKMKGGVRITDSKSFDMRTESANMDFKASVMTSSAPVTLHIDGGEVAANRVEFQQKDRRATFTGNVRSVIYGEDDPRDGKVGAPEPVRPATAAK